MTTLKDALDRLPPAYAGPLMAMENALLRVKLAGSQGEALRSWHSVVLAAQSIDAADAANRPVREVPK